MKGQIGNGLPLCLFFVNHQTSEAIDPLLTDITYLKGVGPARAKILNKELGITNFRDLLYHFPYKYIDRSVIHRIRNLVDGMPYVLLRGQVLRWGHEGMGRSERLVATFSDGTGVIDLVWFQGIKGIERSLKCNTDYLLLGKPTCWNNRFQVAHPELETAKEAASQPLTMQPHYHLSERMKRQGFSSHVMGDLVKRVWEVLGERKMEETLPSTIVERRQLMPLDEALHTVHHPLKSSDIPEAVHRLKYEELFFLQLEILRYSNSQKLNNEGFVFLKVGPLFLDFYNNHMPFQLTGAQKRVMRDIRADVATGRQMNRLVQGDVGSGKTMVALLSCLLAADNRFQSCLMAPTEILAEQHYASISQLVGDLPLTVALLTGAVKGKKRKEVLQGVADGSIDLLVGTHALIEPSVAFLNLGFVVIDEQHRFGVKQRARLWQKNIHPPHILVMTATPIPRTLAMTVYGDLDVSVIDELPPGRKPIQTLHYRQNDRGKLYGGMDMELQRGAQIYVVYPLIKENEKQDLKDLQTGFTQLCERFPNCPIGIVHGKMKPADKEAAMQAFKRGETRILVSTTVIEVGVNVPNATVMVIENAERFGLAQLHQLRGRVGRGSKQSYCILMTHTKLSENSSRRMQIMVESNDGFVIAEEDMKLRGPGDLEGTAQSGMPFDLKLANVVKDQELMALAREDAARIIANDPYQQLPQYQKVWMHLAQLRKQQTNYSSIS